jgi:transposase
MAAPDDIPNLFVGTPAIDDIRAWMKRMIAELRITELVTLIVSLIVRMRDLNTELVSRIAKLQRKRPPSETLDRLERQLSLAFPGLVQRTRRAKDKDPNRERGKHPGREALPAHLPRVEQPNPVPPELRTCPVCGCEMKTIGHEVCERLGIRPAELVVFRRVDETVACVHDETIVSAPVPDALVPRGKLDDSLIVEATLDKYVEHQPIERQCTRWERAGVHIATQTLGRSVAVAIDVFEPVADLIRDKTRAAAMLGADSSGLRVLDRDHPEGVRTGTIWCWVGSGKWVSFDYKPAGDGKGFASFLGGDLARTIQCDGTSVTNCIEKAGGKRPGCWSHGRRRFVQAAKAGDLDALDALRMIRKLFAVERLSATKGDTPDQRKARRLEHSAPVLDELAAWVKDTRAVTPPKTPLGRALGYLHRQWARLVLFLQDGLVELTNNRVERELRRLVLGRKNWLFVEGDLNGARTATILTILGTCIAQGINPRAYLHLLAKRIVEKWPRARYPELVPAALAATHPELRLGAAARPGRPRCGQRSEFPALRGLADVVVDGLADHALRQLLQVGPELLGQRLELGPERLPLERLRRPHHHGRVSLPALAVRRQPVAPTQRQEHLARPRIGQPVDHRLVLLPRAKLREPRADPLRRSPRSFALAVDRRPSVQGLELPELLDQRPFEIHPATLDHLALAEQPRRGRGDHHVRRPAATLELRRRWRGYGTSRPARSRSGVSQGRRSHVNPEPLASHTRARPPNEAPRIEGDRDRGGPGSRNRRGLEDPARLD